MGFANGTVSGLLFNPEQQSPSPGSTPDIVWLDGDGVPFTGNANGHFFVSSAEEALIWTVTPVVMEVSDFPAHSLENNSHPEAF